MVRRLVLPALTLLACTHANRPSTPTKPPAASDTTPPPAPQPPERDQAQSLPPAAPAVAATDLSADAACGPFRTQDLQAADLSLLDERVRFRFFGRAAVVGDANSGKREVTKGESRLFFGAREMYMRGDDLFARKAAKRGTFDGEYESVTIPARDGTEIVAGVLKAPKASGEMVALAHGWFLDPNRDVLDVAIFISPRAITDVAACRRFAQRLLATVTPGPRRLTFGTGAPIEKTVSYATFRFPLPPNWTVTDTAGIHDFARMTLRKRGTFPGSYTELQLGLDAHPGDWKSAGAPTGDRPGKLFGLAVKWHLTKDASPPETFGGWTVSEGTAGQDHAVASTVSTSEADRDEAIRLAESIRR